MSERDAAADRAILDSEQDLSLDELPEHIERLGTMADWWIDEAERLRKELSCSAKAVGATDDCIDSVMRCADHLCDKIQEYHDQKIAAEMEAERLRGENETLRMRIRGLESALEFYKEDDDE